MCYQYHDLTKFRKQKPDRQFAGTFLPLFNVFYTGQNKDLPKSPTDPSIIVWSISNHNKLVELEKEDFNRLSIIKYDPLLHDEDVANTITNCESPWKIGYIGVKPGNIKLGLYRPADHYPICDLSFCNLTLKSGEICWQFYISHHRSEHQTHTIWMRKSRNGNPISRIISGNGPYPTRMSLTEICEHESEQSSFSATIEKGISTNYFFWPISSLMKLKFDSCGIAHYENRIITSMITYRKSKKINPNLSAS